MRAARTARVQAVSATRDRRLVLASLLLVSAVLAALPLLTPPGGRVGWGYPVVMLAVIIVIAAGHLLLRKPEGTGEAPATWAYSERLLVLVVFLAAVLPYLSTLTVGFLSDDYGLTAAVAGRKSLAEILVFPVFTRLYRVLLVAWWWGQYQLWGRSPVGYHAVSLLLHGLNAVLVYALGRRLMGAGPGPWLAALLFALHPLHTETVAWASCQADLEATLFGLLSLLCLDQHLLARRRLPRLALLAVGCALFAVGGGMKESVASLPAAAVLWALFRLERREWRRAALVGGAYGAVLVGYMVLRWKTLGSIGGYFTVVSFWNTIFPAVPLRQVYHFFFPVNFNLFGGLPIGLRAWLLPLALALMGAFLFVWARGSLALPGRRLAFYGGFGLIMALPVWTLGMGPTTLEGSRWLYLPTIGLMWLFGEVAAARPVRPARSWTPTWVLTGAAILCLWYLVPWYHARHLADETVQAAARVIRETPQGEGPRAFFFENLPDTTDGAQVFRNNFGLAVDWALGSPAPVYSVAPGGDVPQEALTLSALQPGEYVYRWDDQRHRMVLTRSGQAEGEER